jgi:hypothetical protein
MAKIEQRSDHRAATRLAVDSLAGSAGLVGGGGAGAGVGMAVAGPPGAAVGFLAGMAMGALAGVRAADAAQRSLGRPEGMDVLRLQKGK